MPPRGRNCYSLLRLQLTSRSLLCLGCNIVAFYPGGLSLIPNIILIYALVLIRQSNIIQILFKFIYMSVLLFESIMIAIEVFTSAVQSSAPQHFFYLPSSQYFKIFLHTQKVGVLVSLVYIEG